MATYRMTFAIAGLACAAQGRRLQTKSKLVHDHHIYDESHEIGLDELLHSSGRLHMPNPLRSLAMFLAAVNAVAGWQATGMRKGAGDNVVSSSAILRRQSVCPFTALSRPACQLHGMPPACMGRCTGKHNYNRHILQMQSQRASPVEMSSMVWRSAVSKPTDDWKEAVSDAVDGLSIDLSASAERFDLAFMFVSREFSYLDMRELVSEAARSISTKLLVGVLGAGIIGTGVEFDGYEGAVSMLVGKLPAETEVRCFEMGLNERLDSLNNIFKSGPESTSANRPGFIIFADGFSPIDQVLAGLDQVYPESIVAGGLSCPISDAAPSLASFEFGRCRVLPPGTILGLGIRGPNVEMHSAVAQGALGFGPSFTVTAGSGNTVQELDGKPAGEVLVDIVNNLEKRMRQQGIMVGLQAEADASDENEDFLIRQVMGYTGDGKVLVGDVVEAGKTRLRFHVRDEQSASDELQLILSRYNLGRQFAGRFAPADSQSVPVPMAALCFSCNGRGTNMFPKKEKPDHDARAFGKAIGRDVPLAGFFCNGEIGPIGVTGLDSTRKQTHLHGFTAVFAMLWDTTKSTP